MVHATRGSLDTTEVFLSGTVEDVRVTLRQLGAESAEGAQRGAQVVGDAVTEAVEGLDRLAQLGGAFLDALFQIAGVLPQLVAGLSEGALSFLLIGNVASDLRGANDIACGVPYG